LLTGYIKHTYAIIALEENLERLKAWKHWLLENKTKFGIAGNAAFTSREDRNMLSIVMGISSSIRLGEKELPCR
jgi:hypothetical protein